MPGTYPDFVVRFDPSKESREELAKKIIQKLICRRLQSKKPVIIFMGGDSGEGKSYTALDIQDVVLKFYGLDLINYVNDINVYTPLEYPEKLDRLLYNKELKKVNIITMHEAREIIKASKWRSFLNEAIGDVNAMSRRVKRLCIIVISQFIRDISSNIRYTLNYYCKVYRPLGKPARLYWYVLYKDDHDLDKPRLRKRKIRGVVIYPGDKYKFHYIPYIELPQPSKEVRAIFDKADYESKSKVLKRKLDKLIKELKAEVGETYNKVDGMVEFYTKTPELINQLGKIVRGKWKFDTKMKEMHELNRDELKEFESKLNAKLRSVGYMPKENTIDPLEALESKNMNPVDEDEFPEEVKEEI